jgi:hypothetical protein
VLVDAHLEGLIGRSALAVLHVLLLGHPQEDLEELEATKRLASDTLRLLRVPDLICGNVTQINFRERQSLVINKVKLLAIL